MESTGKQISTSERIKNAMRSYGLQKQIASELGTSDANLSKFIEGQLPVFARLLDLLDLEVVERGEVQDLKKVLKRCL
jgi:hypothetical protein